MAVSTDQDFALFAHPVAVTCVGEEIPGTSPNGRRSSAPEALKAQRISPEDPKRVGNWIMGRGSGGG